MLIVGKFKEEEGEKKPRIERRMTDEQKGKERGEAWQAAQRDVPPETENSSAPV